MPKRLSTQEIVNLGLLQEINRQFLHPRGFASDIDEETGEFIMWDFTSDLEGVTFPSGQFMHQDVEAELADLFLRNAQHRLARFGYIVQPVPSP